MDHPLAAVNGIEYGICTESDLPEMVRLLGAAFSMHDPPAVAAGLTAAEFEEFVALLSADVVGQGLTVIARSALHGEMAGALIAEDSASPTPAGMESLSSKFNPILDILGQLDSACGEGRPRVAGESAHLYLLGVSEGFAGQGIAQQLVAQCVANAAHRGYRLAVTEATNRTSQHIFRKHGFVERARGSYRDHRYEGKAYFESIADHGGPMLMDRILASRELPS